MCFASILELIIGHIAATPFRLDTLSRVPVFIKTHFITSIDVWAFLNTMCFCHLCPAPSAHGSAESKRASARGAGRCFDDLAARHVRRELPPALYKCATLCACMPPLLTAFERGSFRLLIPKRVGFIVEYRGCNCKGAGTPKGSSSLLIWGASDSLVDDFLVPCCFVGARPS